MIDLQRRGTDYAGALACAPSKTHRFVLVRSKPAKFEESVGLGTAGGWVPGAAAFSYPSRYIRLLRTTAALCAAATASFRLPVILEC